MGIVNGGLINVAGKNAGTTSSQLALSDGLACFNGSFSGVTSTSISHGLNSTNLIVEFKDSAGNLLIPDTWSITNLNVIEVEFTPAATGNVTVIACIESGLAPITGGVTLLEGLSGIIDLDCSNGSIDITTSGQVIDICAIFTPTSGALLEQKCRDIDILSGLIGGNHTTINGLSGAITIKSVTDDIVITTSGNSICLSGTPGASGAQGEQGPSGVAGPSGSVGPSGAIGLQGEQGPSGVAGPSGAVGPSGATGAGEQGEPGVAGPQGAGASGVSAQLCFSALSGTEFVLEHGLGTQIWTWNMWSFEDDPILVMHPDNVYPSGNDHVVITICTPTSGCINLTTGGAGASGVVGSSGMQGESGPSGAPGPSGATGAQGEQGPSGVAGPSGATGATGAQGPAGSGGGGDIDTQTSINGLSGVVDLVSLNDGLSLTVGGQVIQLDTMFDSASGVLLDTVSDLVASGVVNQLNGLSGVVQIIALDGLSLNLLSQVIELDPSFNSVSGVLLNTVSDLVASGVVNQLNGLSGLVTISSGISNIIQVTSSPESGILLDLDITLLEQTLTLSGISKLESSATELFQETTSTSFEEVLTLSFSPDSSGIHRCQWSFQGGSSQANKVCEFRLQLDDATVIDDFMNMTTSFNVGGTGDGLQFGGFVQFGTEAGSHSIDFDFRFADTGGASVQISNLRVEVLQVL